MRTLAVLALALLAGPAAADGRAGLAGTWISELAGAALTLELRADGTAAAMGEMARWSVRGDRLVIGEETFRYQLAGGRLQLTDAAGTTTGWQRAGAAKAGKGAQAAAQDPGQVKAAGGRRSPVDAQLQQLLLSSAWCSFHYNKNTGTTNQSRAVFQPDGTLRLGTDAQTYNSGAAGSVAGQYQTGSGMRWAVQNGRLLIDSGEGFQDVALQVNRNSAGNPILVADGKEYAACR
jgi:hypothetical protein